MVTGEALFHYCLVVIAVIELMHRMLRRNDRPRPYAKVATSQAINLKRGSRRCNGGHMNTF